MAAEWEPSQTGKLEQVVGGDGDEVAALSLRAGIAWSTGLQTEIELCKYTI